MTNDDIRYLRACEAFIEPLVRWAQMAPPGGLVRWRVVGLVVTVHRWLWVRGVELRPRRTAP